MLKGLFFDNKNNALWCAWERCLLSLFPHTSLSLTHTHFSQNIPTIPRLLIKLMGGSCSLNQNSASSRVSCQKAQGPDWWRHVEQFHCFKGKDTDTVHVCRKTIQLVINKRGSSSSIAEQIKPLRIWLCVLVSVDSWH